MPGQLPVLGFGEARHARVVLLTITWAGQIYRVATRAVEVITAAGQALPYAGTLDPITLTDSLSRFGDDVTAASVPLEFYLPAVDVAKMIERGHRLADMRGELAAWRPSTTWEQRQVLLVGRFTEPVWDDGAPISASLEEPVWEDRGLIPNPAAVVVASHWPSTYGERNEGRVYPYVFGAPGAYYDAEGVAQSGPATPALFVDVPTPGDLTFVVAGHHVAAGQVTIHNLDEGDSVLATVVNTADDDGRSIATVTLTSPLTPTLPAVPTWAEEHDYWASWTHGGAHYTLEGDKAALHAGDILRLILSQSTLPVDHGRLEAAAHLLRPYHLGGYIDEPLSPWDFVRDYLLPLMPVHLVAGPDGLYPLVWQPDMAPAIMPDLSVARGDMERAGPVQLIEDEPITGVRVLGALHGGDGSYLLQMVESANPAAGPERSSSIYAGIAWDRAGRVDREHVVESGYLWDRATMRRVALYHLRRRAFQEREVPYYLHPRFEHLYRNQHLTVTDAGRRWDRRVVVIDDLSLSPEGRLLARFWMVEDPARDHKAVV